MTKAIFKKHLKEKQQTQNNNYFISNTSTSTTTTTTTTVNSRKSHTLFINYDFRWLVVAEIY